MLLNLLVWSKARSLGSLGLSEALEVMKLLRKEAGLPIDWTVTPVVKPIFQNRLEQFRESKDPIPTRVYLIRLGPVSYFQTRRSGQIISTPSESKAALFETRDQADECVGLLKKLNITFAQVVDWVNSMQFRKRDLVQDIESLGLLEL